MKNIMRNRYIPMAVLVMTFIMMSSPIGAISNNETVENITAVVTYRSYVDQDYGFYRVIDYTAHKPAPYINNTLTINVGDIVEWINDATPDEPLTIMSKEGLWGNRSAYLRWNYQKFSYTFNQSGTYDIYIKEYPRKQHQIIIVKDIPGTIKIISTPTIVLTTMPVINDTEDNLSNVPAVKKSDSIPIEIIVVVCIIMILIIYIYRSNKK